MKIIAVLLAAAATVAMAQQPTPPAAASSSASSVRSASAVAPAAAASGGAGYQSAFEGYRRYDDQPVGSWREANDLVGRIGGWQAYAREGQVEGHDMGGMKNMPGMNMPGMDPKSGDTSAKGAAAVHDMGSMKSMPGMSMPGTESKPNGAAEKEGAGGRPKDSMKGMSGMNMPPADSKPAAASSQKGHDMKAMKEMPGKSMAGMGNPVVRESTGKDEHAAMAMGKGADDSAGKGRSGPVVGTGVVQGVDKANGKVKLTHDPIAALGWPRMTMDFRLKDSALAEKVKEGDPVAFSLEKSASGYVISGLDKTQARGEEKKTK